MVLDPVLDDLQVVEPGAELARDGRRPLRLLLGQHPGRPRRVIVGEGLDLVPLDELPALGKGLGMGIEDPDVLILGLGQGQQAVADPELDGARHPEASLDHQPVDVGDGAADGVFHGDDPEVEPALFDALEDVRELDAGDRHERRVETARGQLAEGPVLSLEADEAALLLLDAAGSPG